MEEKKVCCFFGHRKISGTEKLEHKLHQTIERLVLENKTDTFLFGSKSEFNSLCRNVVDKLKEKYPHIKRVYVRAEFPEINEDYEKYLLENYEETYFPHKIRGAGKTVYIERNCEMIDKADVCIAYLKDGYSPENRKSGTKFAYEYALQKKREIINMVK